MRLHIAGPPPRIVVDGRADNGRHGQTLNFSVPERRYDPRDPEMMDRADADTDLLDGDLRNLRAINKWLGGLRVVRRGVAALMTRTAPEAGIDVLDLATGSADYPVDLAKRMRQSGRSVRVVAVDKNPFMVEIAQKRTAEFPEITVDEMDIRALPFPDGSFDIVLCSSAIHHLSREEALHLLADMNRIARIGFVVNDLDRSRAGAWAAWLYGHLSTSNPITRYDSYLSMLRAFTMDELAAMTHEAGVRSFTISREAFFRLLLVGVKS